MPCVNIKITNEGATAEQKAQLIQGVTKLLQDIFGKNPQTTCVVIELTHGEKEISRIKGNTFSSHPSLNRETPATVATAI